MLLDVWDQVRELSLLITSFKIYLLDSKESSCINIQRYLLTPDSISQVFVWIGKDANEVEKTESVKSGEMQQAHIP